MFVTIADHVLSHFVHVAVFESSQDGAEDRFVASAIWRGGVLGQATGGTAPGSALSVASSIAGLGVPG
jgi:hypothetical protein